MLMRTHLMIGLVFALVFFPYVNNKVLFIPIVLLASLAPDIDCAYSYLGRRTIFRPLQFFVRHRGVIHSFTIAIIAAVFFALIWPAAAFPFFLGYSLHLLGDSVTIDGIRPFWPWKDEVSGKIRTGGTLEYVILGLSGLVSVILIIALFSN